MALFTGSLLFLSALDSSTCPWPFSYSYTKTTPLNMEPPVAYTYHAGNVQYLLNKLSYAWIRNRLSSLRGALLKNKSG